VAVSNFWVQVLSSDYLKCFDAALGDLPKIAREIPLWFRLNQALALKGIEGAENLVIILDPSRIGNLCNFRHCRVSGAYTVTAKAAQNSQFSVGHCVFVGGA